MDFFSHQEQARKASRLLTVLFTLAVIAVVVAVCAVVGIALESADPVLIGAVALGTLAAILGGSAVKIAQLSDGGSAVAEMMDGRRITPATTDFDERRLLNVVEEMAIASGVPVPLVYVMDREESLNAFAAGYSPNDAAVAVTRGLMKSLSRDELQGVIAHEFSHVLNGDMRLNVRMIGLLFGIEMIAHAGRLLARTDSGSNRRNDLAAFGLALLAVGAIGMFLANIIRAAVGRQREHLADASAVQFTRNPDGIGNALIKIATRSGLVSHRNADEVSHMFIAGALKSTMSGLTATHPPIEERIERVLGKNGMLRLEDVARKMARMPDVGNDATPLATTPERAGASGFAQGAPTAPAPAGGALAAGAVIATIGQPRPEHVDYARALLDALPEDLRQGITTPEGALGIVAALLVPEASEGTDLRRVLAALGDANTIDLASWFAPSLRRIDARLKLPLAALALPVLRVLPEGERARILSLVRAMIAADGNVTSFELALSATLARQLGPRGKPDRSAFGLVELRGEVTAVVSMFVRAASQGSVLFDRVVRSLGLSGVALLAPAAIDLAAIEQALPRLAGLAPAEKQRLIRACMEVVLADRAVTVREAELMRAVCAALEAPLPPVIDIEAQRALEVAA